MKNKAALTVLFLLFSFICGGAVLHESEAAVNEEEPRPPYYYDSASGEIYIVTPEPEAKRYPDYLPQEFGMKPEEQQVPEAVLVPQSVPGQGFGAAEAPASSDFVPYDYAQEMYKNPNVMPPEQPLTQQALPQQASADITTPETSGAQDDEGFVPYEYAREKYSDYTPAPQQ